MKVLSLFDGMSCGQIALRELGIIPETYYASEIDRHAIAQTRHNFPDTVQLGDVERWREWDINWEHIDLVMGGSPCQGFSFAGKQLAFDDPRSRLFFVFTDILTHARKRNPDVKFLLENVNMKKEHMRVISEYVGVFPANINSSLVSAQNRNRWYWTDIRTRHEGLFGEVYSDIPQPEDRGIMLRDILDTDVDEKYYLSDKGVKYVLQERRIAKKYTAINGEKSLPLMRKGITNFCGTHILQLPRGYNKGGVHEKKAPNMDGARIRRLTPTECARLQTIPEWYRWACSETQQYKMLGNGWTVEVIKHILSFGKWNNRLRA